MTEEEKQELDALRKEKHHRTQQTRAEDVLKKAGIPAAFAPLLVGTDDVGTDTKTEQFCAAYQAAVAADIRNRLPQQAPIVTPPVPARERRGIHRVR